MAQGRLACLIQIVTEEQAWTQIMLPPFVIGRSAESDLPLAEPTISRQHLLVEFKNDHLAVSDLGSNNGTFVNGKHLAPQQPRNVDFDDKIQLGTSKFEIRFMAVPAPLELTSPKDLKNILLSGISELSEHLEAHRQQIVEEERKKQSVAWAREESQKRIQLDEELERTRQEAQAQLEQQIAQAQAKRKELHELAIAKTEAEIQQLRRDAQAQMEAELKQSRRKAESWLQDAKRQSDLEVERRTREAIENARIATLTEQQSLIKSYRPQIQQMQKERAEIEQELRSKQLDLENLTREIERNKSQTESLDNTLLKRQRDLNELESQILDAQKIIDEAAHAKSDMQEAQRGTDEAKAAKLAIEQELAERKSSLEREVKAVEDDLKAKKEAVLMELTKYRKEQEDKLAGEKLNALEELKSAILKEESRYKQTLHLRSTEIATQIEHRLIPKLEQELKKQGVSASLGTLLDPIRTSVAEVTSQDQTVVRAVTEHLGVNPEKIKKRKIWIKRILQTSAAAALLFVIVAHRQVYNYFKNSHGNQQYLNYLAQKMRLESEYHPQKTNQWHRTFYKNVLYLRHYYKVKLDPNYQTALLDKLDNLEILRPLGLNESDIVAYLAKEQTLMQDLGRLRKHIDARFLKEGLNQMKAADSQAETQLQAILLSKNNFKSIRKKERKFTQKYIKDHFDDINNDSDISVAPASVTSSQSPHQKQKSF